MITIERMSFAGWNNCIYLSNGYIELISPTVIGPRILYFGFVGDGNVLFVDETEAGMTGGDDYRIYGGHRLWTAPQSDPRTYQLENEVLNAKERQDGFTLRSPVDDETGIGKELTVRICPTEPRIQVTHRLRNENLWPVETAAWGITQLEQGSTGVVPLSSESRGMTPDRSISLWPYSSLSDPRLRFADETIWVEQSTEIKNQLKIGATGRDSWIASVHNDSVFLKSYPFDPDATYPDLGSAVEVYTDETVIETETLGPLSVIDPGKTVEFTEEWTLLEEVDTDDRESILQACHQHA